MIIVTFYFWCFSEFSKLLFVVVLYFFVFLFSKIFFIINIYYICGQNEYQNVTFFSTKECK